MEEIRMTIYGDPKAQKRHRHVSHTRGGKPLPFTRTYDPSAKDKDDLIAQIIQHRPNEPWSGPILMTVTWYFPRPKYHYGTGRNSATLKATAPLYHTPKPDVDNLKKILMDAMQGIFFANDSQICAVYARKVYDSTPRTVIVLDKLKP